MGIQRGLRIYLDAHSMDAHSMDTALKTQKNNPWMSFVRTHKTQVRHLPTRKEQYNMLAKMWSDQKASLVTINIDHLQQLHHTIDQLKKQIEELNVTCAQYEERLAYLENDTII